MCYEQKLNAITRLIILITILGYISTMSTRILVIGFLTLAVIFVLFKMRKQKLTKEMMKEGFFVEENNLPGVFKQKSKTIINPVTLDSVLNDEFKEGNKKNPFSNVLLTQINDDPERKSAPPAFNVDVDEDITKNIKRSVQMMNPGIKNTNKQLYGDLWQQFELDNSNRVFYSTANTRVANDQGAYAQFLYNDLKYSAKESTPEGAIARVQDNYRYTLY
jgi:c-di-AMP phosphodiesterase-like protein